MTMSTKPAYPNMPKGTRVRYSEHGPCMVWRGREGVVTGVCPRAGWILVSFDGGSEDVKCGVLALDVVENADVC
jgi:hypothetical protein